MFTGLSTLRKEEKKTAVQSEEAKKLQAYLAKYTGAGAAHSCLPLFAQRPAPVRP